MVASEKDINRKIAEIPVIFDIFPLKVVLFRQKIVSLQTSPYWLDIENDVPGKHIV